MERGSQNCKSQTAHNQETPQTPQTPAAKKPPTLINDVPTLTTVTSSYTPSANYSKLIEEQQKVITRMQEKIHTLQAKVYEFRDK